MANYSSGAGSDSDTACQATTATLMLRANPTLNSAQMGAYAMLQAAQQRHWEMSREAHLPLLFG